MLKSKSNNITILNLITFFSSLYFYHQIITLYFLQRGLNYVEINSLWGIIAASKAMAEVPTGIIADKIGRKFSIIIALALMSPIDHIGEKYLFSVHMVQHILLAMVAPPLILLGIPRWMMRWTLDFLRLASVVKFVTNPLFGFVVFNASLIAWHVPALYEAALRDPIVHIVEHLFFVGAGLLSWYPVVDPAGQHALFHPLAKIAYLFAFVLPSGVLGAAFAFARQPIYATYASAPRLWGLSPMDDQALAGGIMWIPGWAIYFVALSIVFALWMRREEQSGA